MSRQPGRPSQQQADRSPSEHSRFATQGVWCFERNFPGQDEKPPVRLVVFDWDETLTLSTFLPADHGLRSRIGWNQWAEYITLHNFDTPFVETKGKNRVQKLQALFKNLCNTSGTEGGARRKLAILTRNNQGAIACLNLLLMAGIAEHFCAIWCMARVLGVPNAVYQKKGSWCSFNCPLGEVYDHKADVLVHLCAHLARWFPQYVGDDNPLKDLTFEEIVLVDDVRSNFQSPSPEAPRLVRYCKVARYDCHYREMGFRADMGGLGAKTDTDYDMLLEFVRKPWEFKEMLKARCIEKDAAACAEKPQVKLVCFEFDSTLTLHTWMPEQSSGLIETIGDVGSQAEQNHFATYNFASPYTEEDRIEGLRKLFEDLTGDPDKPRALAVLTQNEYGAVAVLNLLIMAGLDRHFSAIWAMAPEGVPRGVYQLSGHWHVFDPPLDEEKDHLDDKATVLREVVAKPQEFFPQIRSEKDMAFLEEMSMVNIVLVDDEADICRPETLEEGAEEDCDDEAAPPGIVRHCEVTRYEDDDFRDKGFIPHMGGLGAKTHEDFAELRRFVKTPWCFREAGPVPAFGIGGPEAEVALARHIVDELELEKGMRKTSTRGTRRRTSTMGTLFSEAPGCGSNAISDAVRSVNLGALEL